MGERNKPVRPVRIGAKSHLTLPESFLLLADEVIAYTIATFAWLVTMLIFLAIVTYIPELSLWLPRMLGML